MNLSALDLLLFVVLPYVALFTAIAGMTYRYWKQPQTVSSLSSQLLENRKQFWAVVLFHYGVVATLIGHAIGLLLPRQVLAWNAQPLRLYVLEAVSIALGTTAFVGIVLAISRRASAPRLWAVTSIADWVLLILLFVQLLSGLIIAFFLPWGSYWYHASAVPYLRSVFEFHPDASYVAAMPAIVKVHVTGAWLLVLAIPFTRLAHMLVAPIAYLFRKPQVSRWRIARSSAPAAQSNGNALQLALATGAFALCFAVFGSVSAMMPIIRKQLHLDPLQASIAVAVPVLLGSLGRIPLGMLTDRFGGRIVFSAVMAFSIVPAVAIGHVTSFYGLLIFGFLIGVALASFSVGVAFTSGWYPPGRQGTALGIYGAGNIGQSLAAFGSPVLAAGLGYVWGFQMFAVLLAIWLALFMMFARNAPRLTPPKSLVQIMAPLKETASWKLSLYYFLTFGGFVAMAVYLPIFLTETFHFTPKDAGIRTALFIVVATALRPVGGWLSDKVGGRAVLTLVFPVVVLAAVCLAIGGMALFTIGGIGMATAIGLGNGAVFKLVPEYFPATVGSITGLVGAAGGLGGFFPPLVLGVLKKSTGSFTLGFVFLGLFAAACLLVVRPKLFALCLVPPEPGSPPRTCWRQRYCPHARSCPAAKAA
ncbi:MAG TPA: respiratory nitrate reductase subunit gamma [Candidatus Angelobacter sp.]|nr:respiratory nitrate reductase subunit gamma [Candidatus Angelobacter sp.]